MHAFNSRPPRPRAPWQGQAVGQLSTNHAAPEESQGPRLGASRPRPDRDLYAKKLVRIGSLLEVGKGKRSVSIEEAKEIILSSVRPLGMETISILEAGDRFLAEDVISRIMIPPLDCSAMDGYAVVAEDTRGAAQDHPVTLQVIGEARAGGSIGGQRVLRGTAVRIMTGAAMPEGADAVVQVERTQERSGYATVFSQTAQYNNYRRAGENIAKGDKVLDRGERLSPADVGILASLNHASVKVYRQPRVAIISTGDELAGVGEEIQFGGIRDVNAYTLCAEIKKYGGVPEHLGIARDSLKDIKALFLKALEHDVVISTGGVSMGRYDFVKEIYASLGIEMQFEWVNVKPGKPCVFGTKGGRLVFGLPGSPVSTLTSFIQFVRPALLRLMGAKRINKPVVNAVLEESINKKQTSKVRLLRGCFTIKNNEFYVSTTGDQKSSVFRSMSEANCLIMLPENVSRVQAGEKVAIQLINHDEV